jgi:preprotein translocase subunit SecA
MRFQLQFYENEHGDSPVLRWLREALTPTQRRAIGVAMAEILQAEGIGVVSQGLSEIRDDSATPGNVEQVVERALERHDRAEEGTLRRVVEEAMETYYREHPSEPGAPRTPQKARSRQKTGRNEQCPCGSEQKYKKCCGR